MGIERTSPVVMILGVVSIVKFCVVRWLILTAAPTTAMSVSMMMPIMPVYAPRLVKGFGTLQALDLCLLLIIRCFCFLEDRKELFSLRKVRGNRYLNKKLSALSCALLHVSKLCMGLVR